ncbi:MAG: glutathione S-transferase family protein [Candidatus Competibacteraceae bacterium]
MLTVFGFPNTRSARAVWALEEAGADYDYIKVDLFKGEGRRPPYIDLNPGGKVPALRDGDFVLTESSAICTYIGDKFPESGLTPSVGTQERARYLQWCFFVIGELEQPLWTMAKHRFALPEKRRIPAVIDTAIWEFEVAAKVLATGLGDKQFIAGENFTAADIMAAQTLAWARVFELPLNYDSLETYADRMLSRPTVARARAREQS